MSAPARCTGAGSRRRLVAAAVLAALLAASPASAQRADHRLSRPLSDSWVGDAAVLSLNAAVGGLTAGVLRLLRDGSFSDGFAGGALGGGIAYVGKRVAVERFDGAGLLGREIAAVGGSFVRNAGRGRPLFDELILPVGPVNLYIRPDSLRSVGARLDLLGAGTLLYGIVRPEMRFDAGASLSAGAPVFETPDHDLRWNGGLLNGFMTGGAVFLSCCGSETTFPHERVHVIQRDVAFRSWGEALQGWWQDRVPGGRALGRYLDVDAPDMVGLAIANLFGLGPYSWWLGEIEADFLEEKGR